MARGAFAHIRLVHQLKLCLCQSVLVTVAHAIVTSCLEVAVSAECSMLVGHGARHAESAIPVATLAAHSFPSPIQRVGDEL